MTDEKYTLYQGDCLEKMQLIQDKSVDLVLCDLPYGQTKLQWDSVIPFDKLWQQYNRVLKDDGIILLFCCGLFTVDVINSNRKDYKYKLIWKKNVPTGMSSAKYRPMKYYEEICVFQKGSGCYNPIMKDRVGVGKSCYNYDHYCGKSNHVELDKVKKRYDPDFVQPSDVLEFNVVPNRKGKLHPTEKPVQLLEYLIKTYSNEISIVLDNCRGSGSCGEACINTDSYFIGIEANQEYYQIASNRLSSVCSKLELW